MAFAPAPVFQQLRSLPTPRIEDVIFFETVDCTRQEIPQYGTPHPDAQKWPGHKLGYAEATDAQGLVWKWWYVADREEQDLYDGEKTLPYFNNPDFPRFQRTLILPRGTGPGESFEEIPQGTPDSQFPDALLVSTAVFNIDPPLNSLYQRVVRIYDKIPGGSGDPNGGGGGDPSGESQSGNGVSWIRPLQTSEWIRLTWKITLPIDLAKANITPDLEYCIIPGFENLRLVDEATQDTESGLSITVIRIYEGLLEGPPSSPSPVVKKQTRDIPGALPPDKFCSTMTVVDDVTKLHDPNDEDVTTVIAPSGVLIQVDVSPDGGKLLGQRGLKYGTYSKTSLTGRQWDDNLKAFTTYTIQVLSPADAATLASGAAAGTEVTLQPLNTFWTLCTSETPPVSTIGSPSMLYYTSHPWSWPRVLTSFQYGGVGLVDPPDASILYMDYEMTPEWQGLCKSEVRIAFYATNPIIFATTIPVQQLAPTGLDINWPGVGSFRIPSCLHGDFSFSGTTGTGNPVYDYTIYTKDWPASQLWESGSGSDQAIWPDSLIIDYDVQPYKNGFLVKQVKVFKPY